MAMQTYFDCLPCFLQQTLGVLNLIQADAATRERVLREVLSRMSQMDLLAPPPALAQEIHRRIRQVADCDPYADIKRHYNQEALLWLPQLRTQVQSAADPLETAVRLAIAGNTIDFGVHHDLEQKQVQQALTTVLEKPLQGQIERLRQAVTAAGSILYLADNAGEIVLDRLLLEQLPADKLTIGVKGSPIINDATMEDAQQAGLRDHYHVVSNDSDAPGNLLSDCSFNFRHRFSEADLVLAKGQANYETLSHENQHIFFILMAKCPVIARDLQCHKGDLILREQTRAV